MAFADDLSRYGPDATAIVSLEEARAYCAHLTASHYENFSVVTWLTPRELRPHFQSIYAFCRWSDDLGDEIHDRDRSRELLRWWRRELRSLYEHLESSARHSSSAKVRHPVMIALQSTIERFRIPIKPFEDLISAFEQDQEILEYQTDEQLRDYCTRSANPVGHLVLYLAESFNPDNAAWSDSICTGLQLANFWQDVDRDLSIGRIYLPKADRTAFGYLDSDLQARRFTPEFANLLKYKVQQARDLFNEGEPLAARLPKPLDVAIALFRAGGLEILKRIEAQNYDVWKRRPKVTKLAKLRLFAQAMLGRRKSNVQTTSRSAIRPERASQ